MYKSVKLSTPQKQDKNNSIPSMSMRSAHPTAIIQRVRMYPQSLTRADTMVLQRTIGNQAVCRLMGEIGLLNDSPKPVQREALPEEPVQMKKENKTGLPDNLKAGVENLSGLSMDDVRVHYNSDKPTHVGALAYTQGTDIHVTSGQEKHLPHEVWHVVQQAQGRVQPTMQMQGAAVNNDVGLEREASEMGNKALLLENTEVDKGTIQRVEGQANEKIWLSYNQKPLLQKTPIIQGRWLNTMELIQGMYYYAIQTTEAPISLISGRIIQGYDAQRGPVVLLERKDGRKDQLNTATTMFTLDIKDAIRQFPGIKIMETAGEDEVANIAQNNPIEMQNFIMIHSRFLNNPGVKDFVSHTCKQRLVVNERREPIQMMVLASHYGAPAQSWVILQAPLAPGPLGAPNPPGWIGNAHPNHHQRSHLIGGQFGAPKALNNLVTLTDGSNHPGMSVHENILAAAIGANPANIFLYNVTTDNTNFAAFNAAGAPTVASPAPQGVIMDAVNLSTGMPVLAAIYVPNNIFQHHAGCID